MSGLVVGNGNGFARCTRCGVFFDGRRRQRSTGWCPDCREVEEGTDVEPPMSSASAPGRVPQRRPRSSAPAPDQRVPASWKRYGS